MATSAKGYILAGAAGLLISSCAAPGHNNDQTTEVKKIRCAEVNACRGKGDCASGNQCKGSNSCKGQGFLRLTPEQCETAKEALQQQGPFDF